MSLTTMDPAPGALVGEKYRLVRPLASGGMGAVWVAHHTKLDIDCAIKFLSTEFVGSPSAEARFEREAKAAAQLKSPHVVRIHDYGLYEERPYMAMELLEGEDLCSLLSRSGRMSLQRAALIARQVGRALAAAHDAGIVHRDLKPSNVFLAREADGEVVKVLDFGIAKRTKEEQGHVTTGGAVFGSPLYMSPEQARGGALDHRSDLWSFGVLLFEMVTGRQAFGGATAYDILLKICGEPLPVASEVAPDLPPGVDAFFAQALARDPTGRFASAREMAQAFDVLANGSADTMRAPAVVRGREEATAPNASISGPTSSVTAGRRRLMFVGAMAMGAVALWIAAGAGDRPSSARPDAEATSERAVPTASVTPTPPVAAPLAPPETAVATSEPSAPAASHAARRAAPAARSGAAPTATPSAARPVGPAHSVDPDFGLPVTR